MADPSPPDHPRTGPKPPLVPSTISDAPDIPGDSSTVSLETEHTSPSSLVTVKAIPNKAGTIDNILKMFSTPGGAQDSSRPAQTPGVSKETSTLPNGLGPSQSLALQSQPRVLVRGESSKSKHDLGKGFSRRWEDLLGQNRGTRISYARVCVEIEAGKPLPDSIVVNSKIGGRQEYKVVYDWKPRACSHCHTFEHDDSMCCKKPKETLVDQPKGTSTQVWKEVQYPKHKHGDSTTIQTPPVGQNSDANANQFALLQTLEDTGNSLIANRALDPAAMAMSAMKTGESASQNCGQPIARKEVVFNNTHTESEQTKVNLKTASPPTKSGPTLSTLHEVAVEEAHEHQQVCLQKDQNTVNTLPTLPTLVPVEEEKEPSLSSKDDKPPPTFPLSGKDEGKDRRFHDVISVVFVPEGITHSAAAAGASYQKVDYASVGGGMMVMFSWASIFISAAKESEMPSNLRNIVSNRPDNNLRQSKIGRRGGQQARRIPQLERGA
ncbi:hypothetical protein QJS10_CPB21g00761 [Acorus calamus]|uniref:Zinc knuckle CX2CX4HX4C domain-containing protein n=1 Tax=Acorus calamus TaxID=4465 RepID=A0AAV9C3F9_ACOCL|nr:hypothetical protein QJS10_CPB21g00761 [Acorus calamus]